MRTIALVVLAGLGLGCRSQQDASFTALLERGRVVMGVDQYTSTHRFESLADGGRIELQRQVDDSAGVAQIRRHLQDIAAAFEAGQFDQPTTVHAGAVPGAGVMAARRDAITYVYADLPRGGEVRLISKDSVAIAAIHQFLAFQRMEHHAGVQ